MDSIAPESPQRYRFDDLTLDIGQYRVWRGEEPIRLAKLTFELLRVLVEAAPNVVTHAALVEKVWGPHHFVTPETLAKRVMLLRRALGDPAEQPRYVEGVRQQGYRLIPEVQAVSTEATAAGPGRIKPILIAAGLGLVVALLFAVQYAPWKTADTISLVPHSIAVLPFENEGQTPADAYLGGFSDELRDQLSRAGLRVAARSSSVTFGDKTDNPKEVATRLGVATVLEGRLGRRGDRLYASTELIDGRTGLAIWNRTFDRPPEDLPAMQQEMAEQIVQQIMPDATEAIAATATTNASANELLLLGRYYEQQVRDQPEVDEGMLREAIDLYRQATVADPDSPLAHSRLAGALVYLGDVAAAEAPVSTALMLDSELSEVQVTLGEYLWRRRQPGAGAAWQHAIELNEYNVDALSHYAYWLWQQGFSIGPESFYRRALAVDSMNLTRYVNLGNFFGNEGRVADLVEVIREIQIRFESAAAYSAIGDLFAMTGAVDEGIAWAIKARNLAPQNPAYTWQLAELYAQIGDFETALKLEPEPSIGLLHWMRRYDELIELGESIMVGQPNDLQVRYLLGFAYMATGQYAAATWVLRSTGLPDAATGEEKNQAIDRDGLLTLANALEGAGDTEGADELADFWLNVQHVDNIDWWVHTYGACAMAILGDHSAAFEELELVTASPRLPWYPILKDSLCFEGYQDDPPYQAVLASVESRWAEIRARLPTTLASHGVGL